MSTETSQTQLKPRQASLAAPLDIKNVDTPPHIKASQIAVLIIVTLFVSMTTTHAGIFPGKSWKMATPESQGLKSQRLQAAISYLEDISGRDGTNETLVIRNGFIVWKGDHVDQVHNVYSCTKTFTSTVLGILIDQNKCTLDTKAKDYVVELDRYYPDLTLRHFTTLTSGYESSGRRSSFRPDYPLFASGQRFHYGDASMNQFANVLTRIAGEPIKKVFQQYIADPIQMDPSRWDWGDFGTINGITVNGGSGGQSRGIHISATEFARFGLLFLNKGNWNGKQLISRSWVESATSPQISSQMEPYKKKAWYRSLIGAYGFNWWVNGIRKDGRRRWPSAPSKTAAAQGNYNNYCFIVPEWNMVIVRMGTDNRINNDLYDRFFDILKTALH